MKRSTIIVLVGVALVLALAGCASMGDGVLVEDPDGRFSFQLHSRLIPRPTDGSYFEYLYEDPEINVFVVARSGGSETEAFGNALQVAGVDPDAFVANGFAGLGVWKLVSLINHETGKTAAVAYQYRENTAYAVVVRSPNPAVSPERPPAEIMSLIGSMRFTDAAGEIFVPADYAELEGWVQDQVALFGGSMSIAALKDGELVYQYAVGERNLDEPAMTDTAYHWGSITKLLTATAVMQQVERGAVKLDEAVSTYVPELPHAREMSVRNLLTHSSGLPELEVNPIIGYGDRDLPTLEAELRRFIPTVTELAFEPGSMLSYNNHNFLLLGLIVERVTGERLTDYVKREILDKAGMDGAAYSYRDLDTDVAHGILTDVTLQSFEVSMENAGLDPNELVVARQGDYTYLRRVDILPAWGGMQSPAVDALRLAQLFLNGGVVNDHRILSRRSVRTMLRMQRSSAGEPLGIGLGVFLGGNDVGDWAGHDGGGPGIHSWLHFYPRQDIAIAVMANTAELNIQKAGDFTAALAAE